MEKKIKFAKRKKIETIENRIKNFIIRNSKNGYYTKISTLSYKFEITPEKTWDIVGILLGDGAIESIHDERSGEMKLCQPGKIYEILNQERKRRKAKIKEYRKNKKQKLNN